MKLKLTYHRPGGQAVDVVATLDSQATVGDLADYLVTADPERRTWVEDPPTLCLVDPGNQLLDRDLPVTDSPMSSGANVTVLPASGRHSDRLEDSAAVLQLLEGPDAPREFQLPSGATVIGRETGCDLRLGDPMVSRRHVRLNVTDIVEVHDLGSANGTLVDQRAVDRAALCPSDVVEIGDTRFSVRLVHKQHAGPSVDVGSSVGFVRSPYIAPRYAGRTFETPQPPDRSRRQRFPMITLFVPVLVAFVLFQFTGQIISLLFMAMSPIMLVGGVLETRRSAKADFKEAVALYEEDLAGLADELAAESAKEHSTRLAEHPDSADALAAARSRSAGLWSRRPDRDDFLELRLGVADQPSRCTVDVPRPGRAPYELHARAVALAEKYSIVADVPVVGRLRETALGVAGPRRVALRAVRSVVAQAVALHSPAELALAALCSPDTSADWDWLKWLPHATSPQSPIEPRHLVTSPTAGTELTSALEGVIARRDDDFVASSTDPAVLLVVESNPPVDHDRLVHLAEEGPARGVHVVWLAADQSLLPAACTTFVSVSPDGVEAMVGLVGDRLRVTPVALDLVEEQDVVALGRELAPVVDLGARVVDTSDIPRSVSQLGVLGDDLGTNPDAVIERWLESASILAGPRAPAQLPKRAGNLRAVLGQSSSGPHILDLRTDGPHALVGGTTGAGKSELLQSWVLSLASAHSPQRVNFLFVDYKGGAAFAECEKLPHSIGVVTDLSPHLVRRALTSLKAELHHRERLLEVHKAKDLVQMERRGLIDAPPSLIIVVDEFAALVKEVPEFVDGVVDVAQRGRSLGLHLILATQRPAGVIKDNLRANTNLRIALRMADADDSTDILGTPDASYFDPALAGRAMSKSGPKSLVPFQASYSGGWTTDEPTGPEIAVEELTLREPRLWDPPAVGSELNRDEDQTDIRRMVRQIGTAAERAGLPEPRKVWQPELAKVVDFENLELAETDERLAFALGDDPNQQAQPTAYFEPDREGNMIVYGTSGAGKSSTLRMLAISAGYAAVSTPTEVYGLDFGSRGLAPLEVLPHVGDIVLGPDHERVTRLLTRLRSTIDERAALFSKAKVASLAAYRSPDRTPLPRIFLLLDGLPAFRAAYEVGDRQRWVDMLVSIMSEGRQAGIHVILSSDQRSALTSAMSSSVQRRIVLRMASIDDYSMLAVPMDVLDAASEPGRALDGGREIQVAVLGTSPDVMAQSDRMRLFGKQMVAAGVPEAPGIASLPTVVALDSLPVVPDRLAIGLVGESLAPFYVEPAGGFLVTGPPTSGRSTALLTLVEAGRRSMPELRWHYLGQRRSALASSGAWDSSCTVADEAGTWADGLAAELKSYAEQGRRAGIVIESAGDHVNGLAELSLQGLVRLAMADGHWVVIEGELSTLVTGIGFVGMIKAARCGLALQPDQEASSLFKTAFPRTNRLEFPPGRGFYVATGRTTLVQLASPWEVDVPPSG